MIPKIIPGKSFGGLVGYNEKKVAKGMAELIGIENIPSPNVIKETLEQVASFNPLCQTSTFHVSLSFPPNERTLDNATLQAIANEFMQGMGYQDNPYAIYRHYDTDNQHIHIVSTRIDWHGKRVSDFQERRKAGKLATEIERKYGLIEVERNKKSKRETQARRIKPGPADKANARQHIINAIATCLEMKNIISIDVLGERLKEYSVGIRISDKKAVCYFIIDENGRQTTPAVPASAIPFKPTYRRLGNVIGRNRKLIMERKNELKRKFSWLHNYSTVWQETFDKLLSDNHLKIKYAENSGGIYGVSFIDTKNGVVFKGSDLDCPYAFLREILSGRATIKKGNEHKYIEKCYWTLISANNHLDENDLLVKEEFRDLFYEQIRRSANDIFVLSYQKAIDEFIVRRKAEIEKTEMQKNGRTGKAVKESRHTSIVDTIADSVQKTGGGLLRNLMSAASTPTKDIVQNDDDEDEETKIKILLGKLIK